VPQTDREAVAISFYGAALDLPLRLLDADAVQTPAAPTAALVGFLTTIQDDLGDIFKALRDDALPLEVLRRPGHDWTPVRALGSHIKGTNGKSQGVIPS